MTAMHSAAVMPACQVNAMTRLYPFHDLDERHSWAPSAMPVKAVAAVFAAVMSPLNEEVPHCHFGEEGGEAVRLGFGRGAGVACGGWLLFHGIRQAVGKVSSAIFSAAESRLWTRCDQLVGMMRPLHACLHRAPYLENPR